MEKIVIKVNGMSCEHCVKAVTNAIAALPGIGAANVDLKAGTATVEYDPEKSGISEIKDAIEEEGYEAVL